MQFLSRWLQQRGWSCSESMGVLNELNEREHLYIRQSYDILWLGFSCVFCVFIDDYWCAIPVAFQNDIQGKTRPPCLKIIIFFSIFDGGSCASSCVSWEFELWRAFLQKRPTFAALSGWNPWRSIAKNTSNSKKEPERFRRRFFFGCNFSVTRSVFVVFFCPDLAHWPHLRSMARTVAVVEVLCGWSSMEQWIWVGRNICTRCSMSRLPSLFQTALSACRCERKLSETKSSTWSVHISSWTLANHWHGDSLSQFGWIWDAPPHPATVMNLIIALFVGDPYQPSPSSVTGEGFRIPNRKIGETIMLC